MADDIDIISTTSTAPRTRTAEELTARVKSAGGALTVNANDSDLIVATNNSLRFTVTQLPDGRYRITESLYLWLLIGAAVLVGVVVLSQR